MGTRSGCVDLDRRLKAPVAHRGVEGNVLIILLFAFDEGGDRRVTS